MILFEGLAPVHSSKFRNIEPSGRGNQDQMCNQRPLANCGLNCKHASHGLSDQCCRAINSRYDHLDQVVKTSDGGICRHIRKPRIDQEDSIGMESQLAREGLPKIAISESSGKKKQSRRNYLVRHNSGQNKTIS